MVDNSHVNEETKERAEEIPKNTEKRRAEDKQERPVHRGEEVSSSNRERKKRTLGKNTAPYRHPTTPGMKFTNSQ